MGALNDTLQDLRKKKRKALAIFITAGDPSPRATPDLVAAAVDAGADIIELGVPFSDPLADGPVIQRSFMRAIGKGTSLTKTIEVAARVHERVDVPLVFMIASTLVINHGVKKFMRHSAQAGVSGVILPDVPPEEAGEFVPAARGAGLDTVFLAAPTSTPERLRRIAELSTGFVYYINVRGVTGGAQATAKEVAAGVARMRRMTRLPVLAGFGVKTPEQARALCAVADGVIIGSRAIEVIDAERSAMGAARALGRYVRSIRRAMDGR